MADTLSLDRLIEFVTVRGGSVRLVGDVQQLSAVGAGGVLRDVRATHGALHLTELMRFADAAEGAASLALRDGLPESLGFYLDQRAHLADGSTASVGDTVITRANNRQLRVTGTDWVKNGDRWHVTAV